MANSVASRSWGMTLIWLVAAALLGTGAAGAGWWAYTEGGWADFVGWPTAAILCGAAGVCVIGIFAASAKASCPSCGATLHALDPGQPMVVCDACHAHARFEHGALHAIAPDHVHPTPIFTARLGTEVKWVGCVACGSTPTRTIQLEITEGQLAKNAAVSAAGVALAGIAGAGFVQTGGGKIWRVPIPYCDRHDDAVALDTDFGWPVIRFRSYAVYRAFLAANSLTPVQPIG